MVEDAWADGDDDGDDKAQRRLLAGCQHQTMMIALGSVITAVAESSAEDLQRTLQETDEERLNYQR